MALAESSTKVFREDGFLVLSKFFEHSEVDEMREEAVPGLWADRRVPWMDGEPIGDREITAVHYPHLVSTVLSGFANSRRIREVAELYCSAHLVAARHASTKLVQSMYYAKPPGALGQRWHQDERFTPTRDASLLTVWIALDDADEENGCLFVVPGSQRPLELVPHTRFDSDDEVVRGEGIQEPRCSQPLILETGDVAIFSGYMVHGSRRNRSNRSRRSLVLNFQRGCVPTISGRSCECGASIDLSFDENDELLDHENDIRSRILAR